MEIIRTGTDHPQKARLLELEKLQAELELLWQKGTDEQCEWLSDKSREKYELAEAPFIDILESLNTVESDKIDRAIRIAIGKQTRL